jgi:hypothetical protein
VKSTFSQRGARGAARASARRRERTAVDRDGEAGASSRRPRGAAVGWPEPASAPTLTGSSEVDEPASADIPRKGRCRPRSRRPGALATKPTGMSPSARASAGRVVGGRRMYPRPPRSPPPRPQLARSSARGAASARLHQRDHRRARVNMRSERGRRDRRAGGNRTASTARVAPTGTGGAILRGPDAGSQDGGRSAAGPRRARQHGRVSEPGDREASRSEGLSVRSAVLSIGSPGRLGAGLRRWEKRADDQNSGRKMPRMTSRVALRIDMKPARTAARDTGCRPRPPVPRHRSLPSSSRPCSAASAAPW